ncbi:MAG: RNA methyltransferase [Bacteroidia bacterium]|nr:RNA methyltransferase [Bacteroidia bacterium]
MAQISNSEIKSVRSLSSKKFRDESGMFIVEGEKMVKEALASRFEVVNVYRRDEIGEEAMARISQLSSPSPVLAVVKKPSDIESGCAAIGSGLYLALDSIRDPGNLGTILRIADWFGIRSVVASRDTVEIFNPKVVQSTMGAIFRVDFHYVDLEEFASDVLKQGGKVYGTFLDGEDMYGKALDPGLDKPSVIVIGNEANGISAGMEKLVSDRLFIPPYPVDEPGSESLNAAVATAVTIAEFRRRARF